MNCVVRFPDGTHTVIRVTPGRDVKVGDEILPRWLVWRINLIEQVVDDEIVQLEARVKPIEPDAFSAG
jgi:hypothetical protein